ncbi:MAG: hypothetical protein CUN56_00365 [Phototrophicales bacterium]|nr:MAG: hypothetical protein CUN56_00365 [Phototrophicales bacterium]
MAQDPTPIREHVGIAIDGGGIKGVIVARALIALEEMLGVERLIDSPKVKVIAGTSTGSLLAFGIAAGMSARELVALYEGLGERVFSKGGPIRPFGKSIPLLSRLHFPASAIRFMRRLPFSGGDFVLYPLLPARYSFDPLREILCELIAARVPDDLPNNNPTLRQLGDHLREKAGSPTVIITAVDTASRETHFLKTNESERYYYMPVVDAVLASSSIPTYWEPIPLKDQNGKTIGQLVDGGVGNFGNPAFVVAWEMCSAANDDPRRHYDPQDVTLFSFGTGTLSAQTFRKVHGNARNWWALQWASRALDLFMGSALREQSRSVVQTFAGIDLRRFQVEFDQAIGADRFDLVDTVLKQKGEEMQARVRQNVHALQSDPAKRYDPEGIWLNFLKEFQK